MIDEVISHYRILGKLGVGGMGVVYRAEDMKLKRPAADRLGLALKARRTTSCPSTDGYPEDLPMNRRPRLPLPNHDPSRFSSTRAKVPRVFAIVLLIGLGPLFDRPAEAQRLTTSDLDPKRDLEVSFSTDFKKGPDAGYIFGKITNKSSSVYPCVHLEFQLFSGKEYRLAGTLGKDVNQVGPRTATRYQASLASPVSVSLKSVTLCREGQDEPPTKPAIHSFRADPQTIDPGDWVSLYWEVKDAQQVLLFDDHGELDSRIELPDGKLGWPLSMNGAQRENLHKSTKFTLVAIGRSGRMTKSFQVTVRAEACAEASVALCRRHGAACDVVQAVNKSASDVCRWASKRSATACSGTAGIWTTASSPYARQHPGAVAAGAVGACITEVANLRRIID